MGTGSSSKSTEQEVRDRLTSDDFHKVSPPSSPSIDVKVDEMSYSGILVEKPGTEFPAAAPTPPSASISGSFAADLSTPPVSNRSKGRTKAAFSKEQPRRIVKATPPPKAVVETSVKQSDDPESPAVHHHSIPALASPIGANAATEMLEESIEKNDSKNKRMERVTNKQKSDREKLLQEKRRRQQPSSGGKPKVQANPFSRFLSAFSVDANPTHKRKEINDGGDPNKRLKFGFTNVASGDKDPEAGESSETEDSEDIFSLPLSPWIAAASLATVTVLVLTILRGSKKK